MKQAAFEFFVPKNFQTRAKSAKLSPRETEVSEMILSNEKNESIAAALNISVHTVDNHVRRIYRKLGLHSRAEVIVFFLKPRLT